MSWFSEIAGKAENLLNKIDQTTANVLNLNSSNDLISDKINDNNNEFVITSNSSLANSQSLPQLKSIFVSSDPENEFKCDFKHGHSRESSTASYHGLTMNQQTNSNLNKNKFITRKPIDDGQLFEYLNNKQDEPNYSLNNYLTVENGHERSSSESLRNGSTRLNESSRLSESINQSPFLSSNQSFVSSGLLNDKPMNERAKQNHVEAIKSMLKEEKHKLNELKTEYKKHTESLNNEINFLKDRLDEHLVKKDSRNEIDNLRDQLKAERANKEKFEKEIAILSTSFSSLKSEFEDYKVRAQRTLQSKDNQIKQLEQQSLNSDSHAIDRKLEDKYQVLESTNHHLRQELEEIRFKYTKLKQETDEFNNGKISDLENQLKQTQLELDSFRTLKRQRNKFDNFNDEFSDDF